MKLRRRRWLFPALMLLAFLSGAYMGANTAWHSFFFRPPPAGVTLQDAGVSFPLPTPAAPAEANPRRAVALPTRRFDVDSLLAMADQRDDLRATIEAMPDDLRWALLQQLLRRTPTQARNAVIAAAFRAAAASDPVRAIRLLAPMPGSVFKANLANEMVGAWINAAPGAAAQWIAGQGDQLFDPTQTQDQLARAVEHWATEDPMAAAKFALTFPPGAGAREQSAVTSAFLAWSQRSAQESFEWARSIPDTNPYKINAISGALAGLAGQYPAQAAAYVQQQLGSNRDAAGLAASVAGQWALSDPLAASQWAMALSDPEARTFAMRQLVDSWAQMDTQGAAQWAAALPADRARAGVWRALASAWSYTDPNGPDKWLGSLPQGRDRDVAVAAYANMIARANPERALAWTQTVGDDRFFAEQARGILYGWELRDEAAAARWAEANNVTLPEIVPLRR